MNPLEKYDVDVCFWKVNKQFIDPFVEYYKNDNSPSKRRSSIVMWLIAFMVEQEENIYSEIPEEQKKDLLIEYLKVEKNKIPSNFDELLNTYKNIRLSYVQRKLNNFKKVLDERDTFIDNLEYSLSTVGSRNQTSAELKDELLSNTEKLYKQYFNLEKEVIKEISRNKGNMKSSLLDDGDLMK